MDAISTSVPAITVPKLHHFYHLKPPLLHPHPHLSTTSTTAASKPPNSISTKQPPSHHHHTYQLHPTSHPPPSHTRTHTHTHTHTHRTAATGYAAALIDAALYNNSLDAVYKDVKRLLKWLQNNEMLKGVMGDLNVEEGVKGRVVKEVAEKAKLHRRVVAMVKMLVAKNKSGMVGQVMEEFERIYFELNRGFRVVG